MSYSAQQTHRKGQYPLTAFNSQPNVEFRGIKDGDARRVNVGIIVCIDNPSHINQFNMLPLRWAHDFYEISTHNDPKWMMQNGVPTFNFDILITSDEKWLDIVPGNQLFLTKRLGKTKQAIALNRWILGSGSRNAVAIPTYGSNFTDNKHPSYLGNELTGKIVIKPEDGARGLCHFVVDFDKVSVGPFLRDLYSKTPIADMAEKYAPHAQLSYGQSWDDEEAQKVKEEGEFTFQRYISDIKQEIRILTDVHSDIGFACSRDRIGDDYKQATSATSMLDDIAELEEGDLQAMFGSDEEFTYFKRMLKEVIGPMQSVDLFFTEGGRWGVCEYCNQYGIAGVPREYATKSVLDFVNDCVMIFTAPTPKHVGGRML